MVDFTVIIAIASATARPMPASRKRIQRLHLEPGIFGAGSLEHIDGALYQV
jgi:hypothetical protein